jgi:hypothetical protein
MKDGTYAQQSFNFSDASIQEDTISKAFIGIANPSFGQSVLPAPEDTEKSATDGRTWPEPTDTKTKAPSNATAAR